MPVRFFRTERCFRYRFRYLETLIGSATFGLGGTIWQASLLKASAISDACLIERIDEVRIEFAGYVYRRVGRELYNRSHRVNHKRVARVMKAHGLGIKPRRRFVRTTDSDHEFPVFPNLYRNVIPAKPDVVWVADITYIRLANGLCFLAAILDACSRKVVGYALSRQIDTPHALAALTAAAENRRPSPGTCVHCSDRGCQCASALYRAALEEFGLIGSMSSPGSPYHNAQAESFMKTIKSRSRRRTLPATRPLPTRRHGCPDSSRMFATPSGCTRRLGTSHPSSSKHNLPGRRLGHDGPPGPASGVDSKTWSCSHAGLQA